MQKISITLVFFSLLLAITTQVVATTTPTTASQQAIQLKKLYVDFDASMHHGYDATTYTRRLASKNIATELLFLKQLYASNNFLKIAEQLEVTNQPLTTKIPKIIHQIWLGSPLPEQYKKYQEGWKRLHPDWEYKLWTDADAPAFKLINEQAFKRGRNFAQKSDIWRYEILERFGGVYIDSDVECLQPLDLLNEAYELYAGLAPIARKTLINNAIIGAIPHHPILQQCMATISATKKPHLLETLAACGPIFFSTIVMDYCTHEVSNGISTIGLLPPTYFYPTDGIMESSHNSATLPSSFAVHYWANEWHGAKK